MAKEVKHSKRAGLVGMAFSTLLALTFLPVCTASVENICGSVRESKAYQQYKMRPVSDFSKLIYLIDRFATCDLEIVYDGHYFKAPFAARVARWFLATNYKKETTKEWILRWCNKTIPGGKPIFVKLSNGKFRLAREILTEELEELNRIIQQDTVTLPAEVQLAPLAQLVVKSPAAARMVPSR